MRRWDPQSKAARTISFIVAILFLIVFGLAVLSSFLHRNDRRPTSALRDHNLVVGTAADVASLSSEPIYAETMAREFNMLEAEAAMKWPVIHPARDTYNFRDGDELVQFAERNKMLVRGHCLFWGVGLPAWTRSPEVAGNLSAVVKDHIAIVVGHYRGRVFAWDVVNEAFNADGTLNPRGFAPGVEYIEEAFVWAHEADPAAKLFYNDFDIEEINPKSDAVFAMVKDFKRRGIPIDGIGFQTHLNIVRGLNLKSFSENLARFASLGIEIHLTEFDVAIPRGAWFAYARQARIYRSVAGACLEQSKCTAIQTWGFTDKHSWIPWITRGFAGDALPFDKNYQPKPAYRSLDEALAKRSAEAV